MLAKLEEHFVVEVNEGIYLTELLDGYRFTQDIKKTTLYESNYKAWQMAKECGGKVKRFTVTYEVMEVE